MSTRSLVIVAVAVWAVAVLVAVFLGLPMLLTVEGVDVNAGLIVNALAAIGAFSAAVAAVWVATRDRRERTQEREAQQLAQATLVLVHVEVPDYVPDFRVVVGNYGSRPVLYITLESAEFETYPNAKVDRSKLDKIVLILGHGEPHKFPVYFIDEQGQSVFNVTKDPHGNEHYEEDRNPEEVFASVRFMDADGIWWRRSTSGDVIRLGVTTLSQVD